MFILLLIFFNTQSVIDVSASKNEPMWQTPKFKKFLKITGAVVFVGMVVGVVGYFAYSNNKKNDLAKWLHNCKLGKVDTTVDFLHKNEQHDSFCGSAAYYIGQKGESYKLSDKVQIVGIVISDQIKLEKKEVRSFTYDKSSVRLNSFNFNNGHKCCALDFDNPNFTKSGFDDFYHACYKENSKHYESEWEDEKTFNEKLKMIFISNPNALLKMVEFYPKFNIFVYTR